MTAAHAINLALHIGNWLFMALRGQICVFFCEQGQHHFCHRTLSMTTAM
jgi:hypothetical protein